MPRKASKMSSSALADLRRQAEKVLQEQPEPAAELSFEEVLHELQVYQIELEMQNEELRRTQLELEALLEKYFDLYNLAPVGYLTLNEKGLILEANLTAATLLGVNRVALVKKPLSRFIAAMDQDVYYLHLKYLFKTQTPQAYELRLVRPDGAQFWANIEGSLAQDKTGAFLCRAMVSDITARKSAEESLQEYSERLEDMVKERTQELHTAHEQLVQQAKLAILGQLTGSVGHELRNPLTVIANVEYLLRMTHTDQSTQEYLATISAQVHKANKIIADLLNFSRTTTAEREKVALAGLVAQVLGEQPPPEQVEIFTRFAPDLPPVWIDPQQIGQVLTNLVVNAYQAMPKGGKLTLSARADDAQVSLAVSDTGGGISPEHITRLFEPLFTTKPKGIGLGLSVSKNLAEANGGRIEVESRVGEGSTFTVTLPTRAA